MHMGYQLDFLQVGDTKGGDAIALRFGDLLTPGVGQTVVVIDGGYQDTGTQLVNHVRTHYGTNRVDLVVSTHPDADHIGGLETVLSECDVGCLWMHQPWNHTDDIAKMFRDGRVTDTSVRESLRKSLDGARNLERLALAKRIPIVEPFAGVRDASGRIVVLGPTTQFYESLLPQFRGTPEPKASTSILQFLTKGVTEAAKTVAETFGYETLDDSGETSAENNSGTILLVVQDDGYLLLTGDAGIPALEAATSAFAGAGFDFSSIKFVQVPHHGSQRNIGPTLLDRLVGPKLAQESTIKTAFVSAPRDGAPKHPSKKVMNAFRRRGAPVHSTSEGQKLHYANAPGRGWATSTPLPFYHVVEE